MAVADPDKISYVIVVRGMPAQAHAKFAEHFPEHRGGVNPRLHETYHAVECELSDVGANLDWIVGNLSKQYTGISLGVNIYTPRNWSSFDVPNEVLKMTQAHDIGLRVNFASPATK